MCDITTFPNAGMPSSRNVSMLSDLSQGQEGHNILKVMCCIKKYA